MAPLVTTLATASLRLTVDQVNAETSTPLTVFLPSGAEIGQTAPVSAAVRLARNGRSFSAEAPGGEQVLVAVEGLVSGTAVIRAFVPDPVLRHGVTRAWLLLGGVGLLLLVLSVLVADQLARSLVRPLVALARVADLLAAGDLSARAAVAGPPEVRRAATGLNRLAARIGELLAHERETVADLSHRLRTPLTALRIDAESLRDSAERERLVIDVAAVERTVSEIIREARRPGKAGGGASVTCDASRVIAERSAFWRPLAEDQDRRMAVEVAAGPMPLLVSADDLATCVDALLGNVFAHTPEGAAFAVRLQPAGWRRRLAGGLGRRARFRRGRPDHPGPVERRLHRTRPGHRPPHRRGVRRDAHHRTVGVGRRFGDARARLAGRADRGNQAAPPPPPPAAGAPLDGATLDGEVSADGRTMAPVPVRAGHRLARADQRRDRRRRGGRRARPRRRAGGGRATGAPRP